MFRVENRLSIKRVLRQLDLHAVVLCKRLLTLFWIKGHQRIFGEVKIFAKFCQVAGALLTAPFFIGKAVDRIRLGDMRGSFETRH